MRRRNIAVIVAHFHPKGLLRDDFVALLTKLQDAMGRVHIVSTRLQSKECARLPGAVSVDIRENVGYDFYSYRTGLDALGNLDDFSKVILMNSSFLCLDGDRLIRGFCAINHEKYDAFGLTVSQQQTRHLQSFLLSFGSRCLRSSRFRKWWQDMVPIDERDAVIDRYEIGLSRFLRDCGFSIGAAFHPTRKQMRTALWRAFKRGKVALDPRSLNPTQFYWDYLLAEFGIVKAGLLRDDPYALVDSETKRRLIATAGAAGVE